MQWVADTLVGTPGVGTDPELARADFQITVAEHLAAARFPPCATGGCFKSSHAGPVLSALPAACVNTEA